MRQIANDTKIDGILRDLKPSLLSVPFGQVNHTCKCGAKFVGPPNAVNCPACRPIVAKERNKQRLAKERAARKAKG